MALVLVQVRACDGECCREKPRWPKRGTCEFLKNGKCQIMEGRKSVPVSDSPAWPGRDSNEVYQETCVDFPQNTHEGRDLMGCCWQWIDDGN